MKHVYFFRFLSNIGTLLITYTITWGQSNPFPCVNGTTTNPDDPNSVNAWDWREENFSINPLLFSPPLLLSNSYFVYTISEYDHLHFGNPTIGSNPDLCDFHPEDGWELLKVYTGFEWIESGLNPHYILYNKYTGLLRMFIALNPLDYTKSTYMVVEHKKITGTNASGVLGYSRNIQQVMSEKSSPLIYGLQKSFNGSGRYSTADVLVGYDPCVCQHNSSLSFRVEEIDSAEISLYGRLLGVGTDIAQSRSVLDPDFLSAVNQTASNGAYVYKRIADLNDKLQQTAQAKNTGLETGLKLLAKLLEAGSYVASASPDPYSKKAKAGLMAAAKLVDGASLLIKGTESKPNKSNPIVIEAEMRLQGTLTRNSDIANTSFLIQNPGSPDAANPSVGVRTRPIYNEPLGIFAVLDTPVVNMYYNIDPLTFLPNEVATRVVWV